MRQRLIATVGAAVLTGALLTACGGDDNGGSNGADRDGADDGASAAHQHDDPGTDVVTDQVITDLAAMRAATARYADDLQAALDDGFFIITQHIPGQGYHFLNPEWSADGFDPHEPPILMYVEDDGEWRLTGFEWVFPEEPDQPPMEGASYGEFPAACHYDDGLFVGAPAEEDCGETHTDSGASFTFWHPDLVTLHVWGWLHNPDGLYAGTNPLIP